MKRFALLAITIITLCGFTYGYKNNPQTGKPDMVATGIASNDFPAFGNASTAKRLTTARTINGVNFDGSANIQTTTASTSDYAKGTWTPVLTFGTPGDLAVTYSVQYGSYVRIGNLVTANGRIITSAFTWTTSVGALQVTGLPFTSDTTANNYSMGSMYFSGITAAGYTQISPRVNPGGTLLIFTTSGSGVATSSVQTTNTTSGTNVTIDFTVSYPI